MQGNSPVTGRGDTPDKATKDAANKTDAGTYDVSIEGTYTKKPTPQPTPIGDYKATLTKQ
jgi:hypothetical protein